MPVDGGGNFTRPSSPIPVEGQTAQAAEVNTPIDDIYSGLNMFPFLDGRKSWRGNQNLNGYKFGGAANATAPQEYVTLAQMQDAIAAVSVLFPGFMQIDTATSTAAPQGWLYANGQEVSRVTYASLWARVSAGNNLAATQGAKTHGQYGPGNGTTTFTLPNMYGASTDDGGYFIRAVSSGRGIGTIQQDENKQHNHPASFTGTPVPPHTHQSPARGGALFGETGPGLEDRSASSPVTTSAAGGHTPSGTVAVSNSGGTESRPKNIAYPVLIKT